MSATAPRLGPVVVDTRESPHARFTPIPITAFRLRDRFWAPRLETNRRVTLPQQYRHLEKTGRVDNFRVASGRKKGHFEGIFFNDSDVYKWLEAASWSLAGHPDPKLEKIVEACVKEVAAAQGSDGYLNSYFHGAKRKERWRNLKDLHEMYCGGHMIQAAVAHHRATGRKNFLDVARRWADHVGRRFGLKSEGKTEGVDGHEEVEMALVELARDTGNAAYRRQAQYFVGARGRGLLRGDAYNQDHRPFPRQDRMTGHAVRQVYLNCGAADLWAETGKASLGKALKRLWKNAAEKQLYLTGGLGSRWEGEAFGRDFELPPERAYTETCAAIGGMMWAWRMLLATGEARYADAFELMLYNGFLAGLSLDGRNYFYQNPLADDGSHRRQPWFGCACCPPNVARTLASLSGYFAAVDKASGDLCLHLYASADLDLDLPGGRASLSMSTHYPWDGVVDLEWKEGCGAGLRLRVPEWAAGARLTVKGQKAGAPLKPGSYVRVPGPWKKGDRVRLTLPMPSRLLEGNPRSHDLWGRLAVMRGPVVYCAEGCDNPGVDLRDAMISGSGQGALARKAGPSKLGRPPMIRLPARILTPDARWKGRLYRTARAAGKSSAKSVVLNLIPYYAWANRRPGRMQVWFRALG